MLIHACHASCAEYNHPSWVRPSSFRLGRHNDDAAEDISVMRGGPFSKISVDHGWSRPGHGRLGPCRSGLVMVGQRFAKI
jgi:hypothetical protein